MQQLALKPVVDSSRRAEFEAATQAKFALWDRVVAEGWFADDRRSLALGLLKDPTVYAYAFFRQDGKPVRLHYYQDAVINCRDDRVMFAAANQIGKSFTLCIKALGFALTTPGTLTVIVSKNLELAKDTLYRIKQILAGSILDYSAVVGDVDNKTELYFRHFTEGPGGQSVELAQSRIKCLAATEGALGYPVHLLLIDELAFFDNGRHFYFQVAQPRTYTTKGPIFVFSNPNGQQGVYWDLWNNPRFARFRFGYLDCPTNTREEYERICAEVTGAVRASTLDAQFLEADGAFLSLEERQAILEFRPNVLPPRAEVQRYRRRLFFFLDLAKVRDRTVRSCGEEVIGADGKSAVYVHETYEYPSGTPYDAIIDDLGSLIELYGAECIGGIGWDNTGVGGGVEDFIKRYRAAGVYCQPVSFDLNTKSKNYTLFKLLCERTVQGAKSLSVPHSDECDRQLAALVFKRSGNNKLQVHHADERDRDDYPDSLVGLCALIIQPQRVRTAITVVGGEKDFKEYVEKRAAEARAAVMRAGDGGLEVLVPREGDTHDQEQ